jgi:hypothetical protein
VECAAAGELEVLEQAVRDDINVPKVGELCVIELGTTVHLGRIMKIKPSDDGGDVAEAVSLDNQRHYRQADFWLLNTVDQKKAEAAGVCRWSSLRMAKKHLQQFMKKS